MDQEERIRSYALVKQDFEELIRICDPKDASISKLPESQRNQYIELAGRIFNNIDHIKRFEESEINYNNERLQFVPKPLLSYFRSVVEPRIDVLFNAVDSVNWIDCFNADIFMESLRRFQRSDPSWKNDRIIYYIFEEGLEKVPVFSDPPEAEDDPESVGPRHWDMAQEVMSSKLIDFAPDAWLGRIGDLRPIRTHRNNARKLPIQIDLRLEELFRAYIFGCWLSVLSICRAILEYAILDNLHKFNIDSYWPENVNGRKTAKRLEHLIEDIKDYVPDFEDHMNVIRNYGNLYMHPQKSDINKSSLFSREKAALDSLNRLIVSVEALYASEKPEA